MHMFSVKCMFVKKTTVCTYPPYIRLPDEKEISALPRSLIAARASRLHSRVFIFCRDVRRPPDQSPAEMIAYTIRSRAVGIGHASYRLLREDSFRNATPESWHVFGTKAHSGSSITTVSPFSPAHPWHNPYRRA